jgi:hypothetical protein
VRRRALHVDAAEVIVNSTRRFVNMLALAGLGAPAATARAEGAGLGGSPMSMERQHGEAVAQDYSFLETPAEVRELAHEGLLERVTGGADFALSDVSFPYARPEVRMLIEHLAPQYRAATREQLVVTSLTRPIALQPSNAHALSVHPAGMAVDFRVPAGAKARAWLEKTLLELEREGVLDVTREHTPSHYHVAVYPAAYRAYLERIERPAPVAMPAAAPQPGPAAVTAPVLSPGPAAAPAPGASSFRTVDGARSTAALLLAAAAAGIGIVVARRRLRGSASGISAAL